MGYYKIANIILEIENVNYDTFHNRMREYKLDYIPENVDVKISYFENDNISVPEEEYSYSKNNKRWAKNSKGYIFYDYYEEYNKVYTYIEANADWSKIKYIISDASSEFGVSNDVRSFNLLSLIMQNVILYRNGMVIHSSAIDYKGNGIAFFAPSGTGKSTHTSLWKKFYPDDVVIINDDSPIVKREDGNLIMYGTPWSGKSNINTNRSVPLKAIVFLRQAHENSIRKVKNAIEALQVIMPEIYKPKFEDMANLNMDMLDKIIKNTPMYVMYCNISKEAVDTVRNEVIK